jgi:hypothetical protein
MKLLACTLQCGQKWRRWRWLELQEMQQGVGVV